MRPLFILRPEPGNAATLARAAARGLDARSMPLFRSVPVAWEPPAVDGFDALLLTSAAAVRLAGPGLNAYRRLPAYAVGGKTGEAARKAGFHVVHVGTTGAAALIPILTAAGYARVLHPGGAEVQPIDSGALCIRRLVVYRMEPFGRDEVGAPAELAGSVVLVHSPRAGTRLADLVPMALRPSIDVIAISDAAARTVGVGWRSLVAAPAPEDEAMLALAAELCES